MDFASLADGSQRTATFFDPVTAEMSAALAGLPDQPKQLPLGLNLHCLDNPAPIDGTSPPVAGLQSTPTAYAIQRHNEGFPLSADTNFGSSSCSSNVGDGLQPLLSAQFVSGPNLWQPAQYHETVSIDDTREKRVSSAMAQQNSRAARNGREQQRAHKISGMIDKLKRLLDKAEVISGDSVSKLDVLVKCESYVRQLLNQKRCYELEAKLRLITRSNEQDPSDATNTNATRKPSPGRAEDNCSISISNSGTGWANVYNWSADGTEPAGNSVSNNSSASVWDNTDNNSDSANGCSRQGTSSSAGSGHSKSGRPSFFGRQQARTGAADAAFPVAQEIAGGSGSGIDDDGENGSTDDVGGGSTSAGTTDSASLGSTTDTTSRGFTTDSGYGESSFGGDSGSADGGDTASGGDAGSADGGSEESEESSTVGFRMRVVNYFDIFRLSTVPMAIASKDGLLVDVNDAMRGFGRISEDIVKTLTVRSLVSPESAQALDDAMNNMLASPTPHDGSASSNGGPQPGSTPFLANAGIGDRPTLMTVSLVYDERGDASAFHVALIPRGTQQNTVPGPTIQGNNNAGYSGRPQQCPQQINNGSTGGFGERVKRQDRGASGGQKSSDCSVGLGERSVRFWEAGGADEDLHPAKRRAFG